MIHIWNSHASMAMQALLPGCNVATMVQLQPQLFFAFDKTTQELQTQVGTAYDIISKELPTDYVDAMVQVHLVVAHLSSSQWHRRSE